MISKRSKCVSNMGLALAAALAFVSSSCMSSRGAHTRDVKDQSSGDHAPAGAEARRSGSSGPEYFEGEAPPQMPASLSEQRPSAPTAAHVWIAGYHTRRAGEWVWVNGHYALPPRSDVVWVSGHWVSHLHGYAWIPGAWR